MRVNRASLPCECGGSGRVRTFDACAFNAALYQLSYQSKNLFRQCSQRTTRIRCTNDPVRAADTSGRVQRMGEPMPSRNCATALFANTVEIGRGRTRITHQADPTDPRNYFAGIGTARFLPRRIGPDTRHDTNLLKITCHCVDAPLAWPLCVALKAKNPVLLRETGLLVCKRELATRYLHPVGTNSQNHSRWKWFWQLRSLIDTGTIRQSADLGDMWAIHMDSKRAAPHRSRWGCV